MTQDRPDRLDRIEAALENLQQRLDNQVEVNAELRTSVTELKTTAEALLQTVQIHQQNFEILAHETREQRAEMRELRVDVNQNFEILAHETREQRAEMRELRVDVNQNFEILAHETREQRAEMHELRIDVNQQRTDINQLQEFERTASAALDRIGSVLDYLVRQRNGNQE